MEPRHHALQHSIGKLQRAMARNLDIQLQRPTWHLCWTSVAARSREDTALSGWRITNRRSFVLVRSGSFMNNTESWAASGSSDEPSWSRSQ